MTRHQYRFLHLFLRYHITGKPVVSPQNVGCFPRLSVGWVPLALFCHLVLTSDYKNYMMFSNSPSGVSVNNIHGGTLRDCYQIYNRNNATLTAFSWTFLYYHQKKKTVLYTAGCKINTITCQVQVTNIISLESMARHLPDNQSCKMYTYMSSKKRKKNVLKVRALYRPATPTVAAPAPINLAAESTSCTWELVWKPRQARAKGEEGTTACTGKE